MNKFTRYNPAIHDPSDQCLGQGIRGELCPYIKVDETDYCPRHASNKQVIAAEREGLRNYRLNKYQNRVTDLKNSSGIKSLREEVGILRLTLETILNSCNNDVELLLYSNRIADLCIKIDKLVTSCDRLENRMGMMLDKTSVLAIAEQFIELISSYVENEEDLESISEQMADKIVCIN